MGQQKIDLTPLNVKDNLNTNFFNNKNKLESKIRLQLLDIVDDFIKTLEVSWVKPKDILLIGSIVNYNWNEYSDIDINIVYDFNQIYKKNTEFVKDYFYAKRNEWNKKHKELLIKGLPIEITVVDINDSGVSNGVYSLEKNEWVKKPKHLNNDNIDKDTIKDFCATQIKLINDLCDKIDTEVDKHKLEKYGKKLTQIEDKLWDIRKKGLDSKEKEMSDGNVKYKVIKHMGYIDKLRDYQNKAYDKCNTIKENKNRVIILTESQVWDIKATDWFNGQKSGYTYLKNFVPLINYILSTYFTIDSADIGLIHDAIGEFIDKSPNYNYIKKINKKGYTVYNIDGLKSLLQSNNLIKKIIYGKWDNNSRT